MKIFIFFALVIALIAVIFAIQNTTPITVNFFAWSIEGSLALILLVTLGVGILISALVSLPGAISGKWNTSSLHKKLTKAEHERDMYQQKAEGAEKEVKDLEEQVANLSAINAQYQSNQPSEAA
jgi:uncharacterized integral membrane protein